MNQPILSICIPTYNRPKELERLLYSIDSRRGKQIEIVIGENKSSKREEIKKVVESYQKKTSYVVNYNQNADKERGNANDKEYSKRYDVSGRALSGGAACRQRCGPRS